MAVLAAPILTGHLLTLPEAMSEHLFDLLELQRRFLLNNYRAVVASNSAYFTNLSYENDSADSTSPDPVNWDVLRYLTEVVGVTEREVQLAGWASWWSDLLAPAMHPERGLLAVRAVEVPDLDVWEDARLGRSRAPDPSGRRVEADRGQDLKVDDVPVPFSPALFDAPLTWVSYDPVDALFLRSVGLNAATSLAYPYGTLGSKEGLWQLEDLGAFTPRKKPRGVLVVVDPGKGPSAQQAALLAGQFSEVWMLGKGHTGPDFYEFVTGAIEAGLPVKGGHDARSLEAYLTEGLPYIGVRLSPAHPVRLPASPGTGHHDRPLEPLALVPANAPDGPGERAPDWLVEDFIVYDGITQIFGTSGAGKTTLLLSMLAEVSRGGEFLGQRCRQSPVVYVSEQRWSMIKASLERSLPAGTTRNDLPDIHFLPLDKLSGRSWIEVVGFVRSECARLGARVAVFDTIARVAKLSGDQENSGGAQRALYDSLEGLVSDGVSIVATRHTTKGSGRGASLAERAAGSIAGAGASDHRVLVEKFGGESSRVRKVSTEGRPSSYENMYLEFSQERVWSRVAGKSLVGEPSGASGGPAPTAVKAKVKSGSLAAQVDQVLRDASGAALLPEEVLVAVAGSGFPTAEPSSVVYALRKLVERGVVSKQPRPNPDKGGRPRVTYCISPSPSAPL